MVIHSVLLPIMPEDRGQGQPQAERVQLTNGVPSIYKTVPDKGLYFLGQDKLLFSTRPSDWLKENYNLLKKDDI